jgi:signal transduction histidine kinase
VVASTFVERNGGRLCGENRVGGGAVFSMELPRP